MRLYVCNSKEGADRGRHLIEIWIYIAQDNPGAADRVLDNIEERFQALAVNPMTGRLQPDIAPELRYFTHGKNLILYRPVPDGSDCLCYPWRS